MFPLAVGRRAGTCIDKISGMENEKSLFDLNIDMMGKAHLKEAVKWARFFAILGFISLGLMIAYTFYMASQPDESKPGI
jgi:hypothetical protein